MPHCSVKNCKIWNNMKNFKDEIKFFSFPKDPERSNLWLKACGKGKFNTKNARICSLHFTDEQWRLQDKLLHIPIKKRLLNDQAIPTENLPENNNFNTLTNSRKNRAENRTKKKIVAEAIKDYELREEIDGLCTVDGLCNELDENNKNVGIQTEVQLECARELKIMELEMKLKLCQEEKEKAEEKAKQECGKLKNMENSVKHIFTKGQIKKLQNPKKKIKWNLDDISSAICLHSAGARAYRYLYKKNHPLPGLSTLRAWATKINVRPM